MAKKPDDYAGMVPDESHEKIAKSVRGKGRKVKVVAIGRRGGTTTFLKGGMIRRTISVDPDVWQQLRKLAFQRDADISAFIRTAIDEWLERQKS